MATKPSEQQFAKLVKEQKSTIYTVCYIFSKDEAFMGDHLIIILKTKCSRYIKRSVTNPKTKRLFYGSNLPSIFPRAVIEEAIILFLLLYHF